MAGAAAQASLDLGGAMLADGEELRYLRALSLSDSSLRLPVVLQPFGHRLERRLRAAASASQHPWQSRFAVPASPGFTWSLLRPDAQLMYLSDRPQSRNDGVVWTGRGTTVATQAGVRAEWRWFRAQVAPVGFSTQNSGFPLLGPPTAQYGDPRFPRNIDLPERFGNGSYGRLDWGDTFLEVEALGMLVGVSNARQDWGPAQQFPLVLSTGSGGFAHVHVGTSAPLRTTLGDFSARWIGGRLEQSEYSPIDSGESARFLVGFLGSFSPSFAPGVEIGGSRIINGPWPRGGLGIRSVTRPFEAIVNDNAGPVNRNLDNGFASVFLRIAPPGLGLEAYAELSRDDFSGDVRQLIIEPDDLAQYMLGIARTSQTNGSLRALRFEIVNGELAHTERGVRGLSAPYPPYVHWGTRQGLTNRGQLLGTFGAYGGAAASLSWELFDSRGRERVELERLLVHDWLPALGPIGGVTAGEIRYALRTERLRFRGNADWTASAGLLYTLNRGLVEGQDVVGLEFGLRWRGW